MLKFVKKNGDICNITIEDFSYILGLFYADANITQKGNCKTVNYEISIQDKDIIEKLLKIIPDSYVSERIRNTNFKQNYKSISLHTSNKDFINMLIENGYPLKDKACLISIPKKEYSERDFWRGIIDGDGSFGIRKTGCYISLVTKSSELKESFIKYVFKITGKKIISNKNKRDDIYNVGVCVDFAYKLIKNLYSNSELYIKRKYIKFKEIEQIYLEKYSKTYITGDCHGNFSKFFTFCKKMNPQKRDIMICLGDVGLNYYLDIRDEYKKETLQKLPLTFIITQGNHEKYMKNLNSYKKIRLPNNEFPNLQGIFYYEESYPNLLFLVNGYNYKINGKTFLNIGGAYSVDKFYRLELGAPWFSDEQMCYSERAALMKKIKKSKNQYSVDYVLSHTCPTKYMPTDLFLSGIDQSKVDKRTEEFLEKVESLISYDEWFFGHFHDDRQAWDKGKMLFECFHELEI